MGGETGVKAVWTERLRGDRAPNVPRNGRPLSIWESWRGKTAELSARSAAGAEAAGQKNLGQKYWDARPL